MAVTLRRGVAVRGKLLGPDGKPVARAIMLHRLHVLEHHARISCMNLVVSPGVVLRRLEVSTELGWHVPAEAVDGVFEVRGLDPENRCGAAVELSGKQAGEVVAVKLAPCGQATARYLDAKGQPLPGLAAAPDIVITPGAGRAALAGVGKGELLADVGSLTNLDRHNYSDRVRTDDQGRVTFPALIPGATYRVNRLEGDYWVPHKEFTAESGKTIDLGDVPINTK